MQKLHFEEQCRQHNNTQFIREIFRAWTQWTMTVAKWCIWERWIEV